ncbi:MAG: hypothetical protein WKG01_38225 [Kofleriaceae bacterium]
MRTVACAAASGSAFADVAATSTPGSFAPVSSTTTPVMFGRGSSARSTSLGSPPILTVRSPRRSNVVALRTYSPGATAANVKLPRSSTSARVIRRGGERIDIADGTGRSFMCAARRVHAA